MICKRGLKGLVMLLLLLSLTFLFSAAASAATVADVANNSLRIGDDIYELTSTTGYTYENVLASLDRGGPRYYFKIGNRWYDLTRKDINTLSDLLDLEKAVPAAEVRTWRLDYRYGQGDIPETMGPVLSTYNFGYEFPAGAVLAEEDINVTVDLYTDEQGAAGYDAAYIVFSADGPGDVTFKIVGGEGEESFENGGALDPFTLPADYTDSAEWVLCFSSAGDYTITFKLMDPAAGEAIAEGIREIKVYPPRETVLAELEACILEALDVLELEETGVSDIEYAEREALVHIDEPGRAVAEFMQSLAGAFRGPCDGVTGAAIYVNGGEAGAIENPAAMSDAELIEAIGRELIGSLTGGGQGWGEVVLGDLEGKSADVELTVARGEAQYSAIYEVNFAINQYSVSVTAENGAVEGAGSYAVGAEVGLAATANVEYEFYSWSGVEGEEVSRSKPYTFAMPNRDVELYANIFRAEAIIEQDRTLAEGYMRVEVAADDVTLDLGGNTVVHLSITGSNVTLQNGIVINLQIGRGVENVILEDISDGDGGNHYFAGGGSGSVVLRGQVLLKGTVYITSREALGICSQSAEAVIGGDLIVETIMPVAIAAPVQGEVRLLASCESITINAEVSRIVALADAMIKISSGIDEPMRPQVERAAGVEVTVSIVDEQGEETGDAVDVEVGEGLSPAARFIFSIAPVADEIKVSGSYTLPPAVEAVLSDRTREDVSVVWCPPVVDTAADGVFLFSGTVEGYDEAVELTLTVYKTHLVSFEVDGGSAVGEQEIRHGQVATEPAAPTREGYTFDRWYKDKALNQAWDFSEDRVTEALTLYARWAANIYEVTFDANGGEGPTPARMSVTYDRPYGELAVTAQEGYTFAGWFTTKAVGGREITAADSVSTAGDHTLYARWEINQYTIIFDSAGGGEIAPLTQDYDTAISAPPDPEMEGYDFMGWQPALPERMPAENLELTAQWEIKTYAVTFADYNGTVLDTQTVEHGSAATAPDDPGREGYAFTGWDTCFAEVKSDLTVTAKYINQVLAVLKALIESAETRTRPGYTDGIAEWDLYWNDFIMVLGNANQIYDELEEADPLTGEQIISVTEAEKDLQRAIEILEGIEDFDLALGGRDDPQGLVETVYERSLVDSDKFQPGRIRCYYEKESGKFYWMLSGFVQKQGLYEGTTGTGMNPGLQNVMLSESIVKLQSGEHVVEIYDKDGNRKNKTELENEGIALATYWLTEANITPWIYASLVGLVEDCKLIGRTSDGVEFTRTYFFRFVDGGTYLFDPHFRYRVVDEVVQKDFEGYDIINVTRGLKYTGDPIQTAVDEAEPGDYIHVAAGIFNENIIISESINLIGSYREGAISTILNGEGIDGAPGISIEEGVGNVSIRGFEIKGFASGGISGISGEGGGSSEITIENNFIHDVGGDAVHGGAGAAQTSAGWTVAGNRIEGFGGSGISFENVGGLEISNNRITRPADSDGFAVGVTVQGDSGNTTVLGITITDNEITGGTVNVTARASGSGMVTAKDVAINGNTIAGGSVELQCGAEDKNRSATIEDVSINNNNIAYPDRAVTVGTLACPGAAHVRTVTIKDNEMTGSSTGIDLPQESGYNNLRNFTITGNSLTVTDPERAGCAVNLYGVKSSSSFTNNTITVTGCAGGAFNGIDISGKDTGTWTLTGNELIGNNVGSAGSGICLGDDLPRVTLNINKNRITGWARGVLAGDLAAESTVKFQRNLIYGNTGYGISNGSGATIEAALNYWGHDGGPQHSSNPEGLGNAVTDNVVFDPWYLDEDFVDRSDGAVHNARLGKYYRDIQAAVDDAAAGDTIKVKAGVFNESLAINKSITLTGVTGDSKTAGPGANAPIIDGTGKGDDVSGIIISGEDAKNIVIEGFEIRNFQGVQSSGVIGCGESVSNVTIRYNYIHDVADHAVCVSNSGGAEAVADWNVAYNKIEDSGDSGICFENVSESLISKNEILNPGDPGSAVLIKGCLGDAGSEIIIEGINIDGNTIECAGRAVSWQAGADEQSVLKDFAIRDNTIISATGIHAGGLIENVEITGNSITSRYCGAENLGNVNGIGIFSDNTVEMTGNDPHAGIWISGDGAAEWIIENNVLDGNSIGVVGLQCSDVSTSMKIDMYRNTVTGWASGVSIITEDIEVTLRFNLIYDNRDWGVFGQGSFVDATLNYWGDETGPWPEGDGNGVSGDIDFDPWYIDVDCTVASDHEVIDQDNVDAAIAKVPAQIASVELPYGDNAGDEEKKAAVKAYIENLEGMAVLRVTVTVEDGSSSGYKVTITRGEAIPGIKDNVKVTFVAPPADREAAKIVEEMIDDLPLAEYVNIDNYLDYLAEVEEAEAAFDALTEPQKALVNEYLVGKLLDLLNKIEELISE